MRVNTNRETVELSLPTHKASGYHSGPPNSIWPQLASNFARLDSKCHSIMARNFSDVSEIWLGIASGVLRIENWN